MYAINLLPQIIEATHEITKARNDLTVIYLKTLKRATSLLSGYRI